ncbi:LADA_0F02410g1_1 [Lachancea dasiensis]|uniref:LADA_0F02410g1_1 n=1 Tax=Lachancea dasiensis TaxID=1072105 RepID=A0A1G4JIR8_9SACH|nr:LADA_0F02410g1_1 [Lachancea dasiensis]
MRNHRVDSKNVAENVKLEVVYESNPSFAGESIQVLLRLKHVGSPQTRDQLEHQIHKLKQEQEEMYKEAQANKRRSWSVQTILGPFTREQKNRQEEIRVQITQLQKELNFHNPVTLTSCYVQIYGLFQYDPEVLNPQSFQHPTDHKLAGMGSLAISTRKASATQGFAGILFSNLEDVARESLAAPEVEMAKVPILLIPQTLIFSEVMLDPGQTRAFQFKSPRLPQELPPSYQTSKRLKIHYILNFGLTEVRSQILSPFNADFNIHICPFLDRNGRQFTSKLDSDITITAPGRAKEIKDSPRTRRKSSSSILLRRKSSMISVSSMEDKNNINSECKEVFKGLVRDHASSAELNDGREGLVDQLMECQFRDGNYDTSEEDDSGTAQESNQSPIKRDAVSVRDNLSTAFREFVDAGWSEENRGDIKPSDTEDFVPQLSNRQNEYVINRNGAFIAKVVLSDPFHTTADNIDLTIHFATEGKYKTSAVTTSLKSFELVNPKYALETSSQVVKQQGKTMDECRSICFEDTSVIHMKLLPQKSPNNLMTSQFKSDIFQFKWMLCVKFVLIDRAESLDLLQEFYEDKNGVLSHAKQSLEGEEFLCHIPLTILPTAKSFAGW